MATTTTVRFQLTGINLEEDETANTLEENFADMSWGTVDGTVLVGVFTDSKTVVPDSLAAIRSILQIFPQVEVVRVDEDLVATSDIAQRVGVSREAVRKWALEHDFPIGRGTVGGGSRGATKVWAWAEIVTWLKDSRSIDMDESLPNSREVACINYCLAGEPRANRWQWETSTSTPIQADSQPKVGRRRVPVNAERIQHMSRSELATCA